MHKITKPKQSKILTELTELRFLLASYEIWESIDFVSKKKIFFFAYFHFLGLFIDKKHDFGEKNFSVCHAPLPLPVPLLDEIWDTRISAPLKARMLKFWLPESFWPT